MKLKNRGLVGFFILLILFVGVNGINAEDDELASLPVNVQLQVSGTFAAPDIVYISDISGGDRSLTQGTTTAKTFEVDVYSSAGVNDAVLPASPTASQLYVTLVYAGTLSQPGGKQIKSTTACTKLSDATINLLTDDITNNDALTVPDPSAVPVRKYTCVVPVPYYANYGNAGAQWWDVRAYVEDLASTPNKEGFEYVDANSGNWHNNASGHGIPKRTTYFNQLYAWTVLSDAGPSNTNPVDFGTVTFSDALDKQPTTTSQPRIVNQGNIDIDLTQLQASDLVDTDNNDATTIPASWFYSHPTSPCVVGTAVNLGLTLIPVMSDNVAYGATGNTQDLKICLKKVQSPQATAQSYTTASASGGTAWNVDTTACSSPGVCTL